MAEGDHEKIDFESELIKLLDREPFHPFSITLTSGERYAITADRQVALGGNTVVVVLPKTGIQFFRKNQIVSVDVPEPAN